jgi:phage antirepressor YoqD-like protein
MQYLQEEIEALKIQNETMKPKAEFFDPSSQFQRCLANAGCCRSIKYQWMGAE